MNDLVYDLEENDYGDIVIQTEDEQDGPINLEMVSDVKEEIGSKIPYPIISQIVEITPDDITIFVICGTDIVTIFNKVVTYYSVEFGTDVFGAFVMPDSLDDDYTELSRQISLIIREYLKILCHEAAENAELITKSMKRTAEILNRNRRPEVTMHDYYNMYRMSLLQIEIQALADKIVQYN